MVDIITIRAKDNNTAVAKARIEYGGNFIILSNKEVKVGGFLGIGKHTECEVRIMLTNNVLDKQISSERHNKEKTENLNTLDIVPNTQKMLGDRKELMKHTQTMDAAQMADRVLAIKKSLEEASMEKRMNVQNSDKSTVAVLPQVAVMENSKQMSIDKIKNEISSKQMSMTKYPLASDNRTAEEVDKKVNELVEKKLKDFMKEYLDQRMFNLNDINLKEKTYNVLSIEENEDFLKNSQMAEIVSMHSEEAKKTNKSKSLKPKIENAGRNSNVEENRDFSNNEMEIKKDSYESFIGDYVDISSDKISKSRKAKEDEGTIDSYLLKLRKMEFPDDALDDIKSYLLSSSDARFFESYDVVKREVHRYFLERLNLLDGIDVSEKKKIIVLVGPTGVGKTTTIPKIASKHLKNGKNVSFVTIDNYRIAAVDQLQRYASIMKIPFSAATTPDALRNEVRKMETNSVLFVDTMGRSPKGAEDIVAMSKYFATIGRFDIDIQLVMSATVKYNDALNILNAFKVANYRGVILTKLDETDYLASSISAISKTKTPITYTTFGQNVPKDISTAKKYSKQIFKSLLGDNELK